MTKLEMVKQYYQNDPLARVKRAASDLGMAVNTVKKYRQQLISSGKIKQIGRGHDTDRKKETLARYKKIAEAKKQNPNLRRKQIAAMFNVSERVVTIALQKHGLQFMPGRKAAKVRTLSEFMPENCLAVLKHFKEHPRCSLEKAGNHLNLAPKTVRNWRLRLIDEGYLLAIPEIEKAQKEVKPVPVVKIEPLTVPESHMPFYNVHCILAGHNAPL